MSEMQMPERGDPVTPAPAPKPPLDRDPRAGSLALGVALAWIINIVGGALIGLVMMLAARSGAAFLALGWLPFLASVALGIWMIAQGPRRTGIGIFIGIGSIWAVALLLVAACFGIFFLGNWH